MPYLVDGHNLIPQLGLSLQDPQDEQKLLAILQAFCRDQHTLVEVYFDGALPGIPQRQRLGQVQAIFIRSGSTADAAIERRLSQLGRQARNWQVVSSDRRVQNAARAVHAGALTSAEFAHRMRSAQAGGGADLKDQPQPSPEQVEKWLEEFSGEESG